MNDNRARATLSANLKRILEDRGMSTADLADKLNMTRQTVYYWVSQQTYPSAKNLDLIAKTLGITVDDLVSSAAGYASDDGASHIRRRHPVSVGSRLVPVRRLGSVHAGDSMEEIPDDGQTAIPDFIADGDPDVFVLRVQGECMDRVIPDGYDVAVYPNRRVSNGEIAVVETEPGEAVMRRWYKYGHTLMLTPDSHNESIEPIVLKDDEADVRVLGVVAWSQRMISQ